MEKNGSLYDLHPLLLQVVHTVKRHKMIGPGDAVLIGASGGPDSTALVHCLIDLEERLGIGRIGLAHLNHCLRGEEADRDHAFVAEMADSLGLPFYDKKVDVGKFAKKTGNCIEDAARVARYRFLGETADNNGYDKIATAHHAGDNAELVLMNLIRGAGPEGLAGIPPVRDGRIIRPLIHSSKGEILDFLHTHSISFMEDSSNTDQTFLRNRVRNHLIPVLKEQYNPGIENGLNRLSEILREEAAWLNSTVDLLVQDATIESGNELISISAPFFRSQLAAVQRRIVRAAIERVKGDTRKITFQHTDDVCRCTATGRNFSLDLPDGIRIDGSPDKLVVSRNSFPGNRNVAKDTVHFQYTLFADGFQDTTLTIKETGWQVAFRVVTPGEIPPEKFYDSRIAFLDTDRLKAPLTLRSIRPGDRFTPLGMAGSQKISDFFINAKVPSCDRKSCPVLVSDGRIVWVAGHRISEHAKLTPGTSRALEVSITAVPDDTRQ